MRKSPQKIAYILVIFLVLPVIGYAVFEYSQLDKNEQVIAEIYNKQLETILFSANQYADDMINTWAHKITQAYQKKGREGVQKITTDFKSISYIFVTDSGLQKRPVIIGIDSMFVCTEGMEDSLLLSLHSKRKVLSRLFNYITAGYQKMEPLIVQGNEVVLSFVDTDSGQSGQIYGIVLNAPKFVKLHLGPRISGIVGTDFVAGVRDSVSGKILFSSSRMDTIQESYSKPLWIIPKYKLIIGSNEISINEVITRRSRLNFIILTFLTVFLLFGALMVFLNIRKQVRLAQIKSEFVSNVSHEIRTPLSIIRLYTETLLMHRASPEKTDEYFHILNQEASRLTNLVNRILSFSQIESQKKKYQFTEVDVSKLIVRIMETHQFHLESKGFKSEIDVEDNLPSIFGDGDAITEILVNLIDNAIKYSNTEKSVLLKAYKDDNNVYVEVHDKGIGIELKNQKHIFEEFYRVPSNLVHNTKGTGLGLSIVKHTMDIHKGNVKVISSPGKGSCFRLSFPKN